MLRRLNSEEGRGSQVSQMKIEDQEDQRPRRPKFDFSVILSRCLVLRSFLVLEGPA